MRKVAIPLVILAALLLAAGCSSTKLVSVWKDPEAVGRPAFSKILAVAVSADSGLRRAAEEQMVRLIGSGKVVPSYLLIPEAELKDKEKAKERVKAAGVDGALVMRVISVNEKTTYVPGTVTYGAYYGSYWGYWGYAWPVAYDPGYLRTDEIVQIETLVYSVTDEKLLWASRSATTNPTSVEMLIKEILVATADRMRREGLIK